MYRRSWCRAIILSLERDAIAFLLTRLGASHFLGGKGHHKKRERGGKRGGGDLGFGNHVEFLVRMKADFWHGKKFSIYSRV
jgi:hypothetical protein